MFVTINNKLQLKLIEFKLSIFYQLNLAMSSFLISKKNQKVYAKITVVYCKVKLVKSQSKVRSCKKLCSNPRTVFKKHSVQLIFINFKNYVRKYLTKKCIIILFQTVTNKFTKKKLFIKYRLI